MPLATTVALPGGLVRIRTKNTNNMKKTYLIPAIRCKRIEVEKQFLASNKLSDFEENVIFDEEA